MYITYVEGIPASNKPFIENQIQELLLVHYLDFVTYDEVLIIRRTYLIPRLQELGNRKMLKRVNSNRHEYYLLFLNHLSKTLKMISLPYTAEYIWALTAA
jgi:hypothetical protein